MKIIISAASNTIETAFNPRFGRADYFILIDHDTQQWEAFANPAVEARGGAGPLAVQFIAEKGAQVVISGRYGPSAFTALEAARIEAYLAQSGTVSEVLEKFLAGELPQASQATDPGMHG